MTMVVGGTEKSPNALKVEILWRFSNGREMQLVLLPRTRPSAFPDVKESTEKKSF
jgi:hypothetical protein